MSHDQNAAGLVINWHIFGSNGQEKADFSRGVLERFTRRAPNDWSFTLGKNPVGGNPHIKTISNPRMLEMVNVHCPSYMEGFRPVNENGKIIWGYNKPVCQDKIIINHYYTKSFEEYATVKRKRGYVVSLQQNVYQDGWFKNYDHNKEFDDGILKYRDAREKIYQPPNEAHRIERVLKALEENISPVLQQDTPPSFYEGKIETFLTCRAVSSWLQKKLGNNMKAKLFEETSLKAILQSLANQTTPLERKMFLKELPVLLYLPYPIIKEQFHNIDALIQLVGKLQLDSDWRTLAYSIVKEQPCDAKLLTQILDSPELKKSWGVYSTNFAMLDYLRDIIIGIQSSRATHLQRDDIRVFFKEMLDFINRQENISTQELEGINRPTTLTSTKILGG